MKGTSDQYLFLTRLTSSYSFVHWPLAMLGTIDTFVMTFRRVILYIYNLPAISAKIQEWTIRPTRYSVFSSRYIEQSISTINWMIKG